MKARNKNARYHRLAVALFVAIGMLVALACLLATSGGGTAAAALEGLEEPADSPVQTEALTAFWVEDFSAPINSTTYYTTATVGSGVISDTSFLLTQDAADQTGRIFYRSLDKIIGFH